MTAVWPLVSMRTFERVTGPKLEHWLVKTVAVLIGVIAVVLLAAAALGAVDVIYVLQRRISRVYLLDAAAEVVLLLGWALAVLW